MSRESFAEARLRILYIHPNPVPPYDQPERNAPYHLSRRVRGDLVTTSWDTRKQHTERKDDYAVYLGEFGYHPSLMYRMPGLVRTVWEFLFFVTVSVLLTIRNGRYSAIVAYGTSRTALAGVAVKLLTRTPLIVEVVGNPFRALAVDDSWTAGIKQHLLPFTLRLVFRFADRLHLLYEEQIRIFDGMHTPPTTAFPDFAATSLVPRSSQESDYVLFLGYPWKLKGVDVLIKAFNRVSHDFPGTKLKIVGHCPDREPFERLADGNPQIEFSRAVPHPEAMALMARCKFFVLPSRTEGIPLVVLEAWAAGKAVVASAVDGLPHLIRHEVDGLLFPSEDVGALAGHLTRLLGDPDQARRLGTTGQNRIPEEFSEECYVRAFEEMVDSVAPSRSGRRARPG